MKNKILAMLALQDNMNAKVNSDWRERRHEWYRAIWVECAEMMDHYGWKWWKKQDADLDQVILELVDIWHFGLSQVLMSGETVDICANRVISELNGQSGESPDFKSSLESFTLNTLKNRDFDIPGFKRLMDAVGLSMDELYRRYVGKNVLNFFRQDHGYKDGSYHKVWQGREDNEHLMEVLAECDAASEGFQDAVYKGLKDRYPS